MTTSRFLFLILALTISHRLPASSEPRHSPSLRLGVDISGIGRQLISPESLTAEFSADLEWKKNFFAALEGGWMDVDISRETHSYLASAYFVRAGADFNLLERTPETLHDVVLISLRYGYSNMQHQAPRVVVPDPYWGNYQTSVGKEPYHAHWLEAGLGLKTRVWHQFFMGWSLRGRLLISHTRDPEMEPYLIGGFGQAGSNTSLMLHYHLYYRFPL